MGPTHPQSAWPASGSTGVILAAGEGRRMGSLGERYAKACLPVCNRPLLHHNLDLLAGMGIRDVVVVVGYREADVREAVATHGSSGRAGELAGDPAAGPMRFRFVRQAERRGIAQALMLTRDLVGERLAVMLGDTYFIPDAPERAGQRLAAEPDLAAVLSVRRVADPELIRNECTVRFDARGRIAEIREKPSQPFNDLKPCGLYFFRRSIFEAIERTPPSALRGEVEITDAIQALVEEGLHVGQAPTIRWDCNLTTPSDLLRCNLAELDRRGLSAAVADGAHLHPGARLERSVVGRGARVERAARLRCALLLEDAVVREAGPVERCVLGADFALTDCLDERAARAPTADRPADG